MTAGVNNYLMINMIYIGSDTYNDWLNDVHGRYDMFDRRCYSGQGWAA